MRMPSTRRDKNLQLLCVAGRPGVACAPRCHPRAAEGRKVKLEKDEQYPQAHGLVPNPIEQHRAAHRLVQKCYSDGDRKAPKDGRRCKGAYGLRGRACVQRSFALPQGHTARPMGHLPRRGSRWTRSGPLQMLQPQQLALAERGQGQAIPPPLLLLLHTSSRARCVSPRRGKCYSRVDRRQVRHRQRQRPPAAVS